MPQILKKLKTCFGSLNMQKIDTYLWSDLKKYFAKQDLIYGIYEKTKTITVPFCYENNRKREFQYILKEGCFYCQVEVAVAFPEELTTEVFILATHFNNHSNIPCVFVGVDELTVFCIFRSESLTHFFDNTTIEKQIDFHRDISDDATWAFRRLIEDNEEPVLIMADLFRMEEEKAKAAENNNSAQTN